MYSSGATFSENANTTLYAIWEANTYTITYNANGGSGAPEAQIKTHDVNLTLSSIEPTRSNHVFLGWSTSSSATSAMYSASGTFTGNEDTTLYAVWLEYTSPYLPTGFSYVAGTDLDTGLVIQDSLGNQYVWVEVPRTTTVYPNAGLSITVLQIRNIQV